MPPCNCNLPVLHHLSSHLLAETQIKGQEIISQEVLAFMNRAQGASVREEELMALESRIRAKLTGGTPRPLTMVLEKKAQAEGDEWGKIFQYSIQKGLELDRKEARSVPLLVPEDGGIHKASLISFH